MHYADAKGILSESKGMNPYRGCTHGCIYCDSRSRCYGFTHPFEDVEVKRNAPELLEKALRSMRKKCMISTGSMCDPYLHVEEQTMLTRRCLQVIDRYGYGVCVQTKSTRILRDLPLLESINRKAKCVVQMTLTTYDESLCRIIEPQVSTTRERAEALRVFRDHHIPTIVWMTPILPFINDTPENIRGLLEMCVEAEVKGIIPFNMGVTLREGDREYFYDALDRYFPGVKQKYVQFFGNRYECQSPQKDELMGLFHDICREHGLMDTEEECFAYMRAFPEKGEQLSLF